MAWVTLKKWWSNKYHQSPKSVEFNEYSIEELLVEFYEDLYLDNKKEMWRAEKAVSGGNVRLPTFGDKMMEKWEKELEEGKFPDISEGLPPKERKKVQEAITAKKKLIKAIEKRRVEAFIQSKSSKEEYKQIVKQFESFEEHY